MKSTHHNISTANTQQYTPLNCHTKQPPQPHTRRVEPLIHNSPDELSLLAPELLRALVGVRTPQWADDEANTAADMPTHQRFRYVVRVCVWGGCCT